MTRLRAHQFALWSLAALAVVAQGCTGGLGRFFSGLADPQPVGGINETTGPGVIADMASTLGFITTIGLLAGFGLLAASFFVPLIPRRAAGISLGIALLAFVARYIIVVYGAVTMQVAFWLSIAAVVIIAVTTVWPLVLTWRGMMLARVSKRLAADGDATAATALAIEATPRLFKTSEKRKHLLQSVRMRSKIVVPRTTTQPVAAPVPSLANDPDASGG